ncbi:proton-conducting transporter membrane subunit, partial [Rhizobium ruizarguesonis]
LNLKLAYTTVSSLGLLFMLIGFGSDHAVEAAALYLVAHSLFKGALFMVAGIIDHETGTLEIQVGLADGECGADHQSQPAEEGQKDFPGRGCPHDGIEPHQ